MAQILVSRHRTAEAVRTRFGLRADPPFLSPNERQKRQGSPDGMHGTRYRCGAEARYLWPQAMIQTMYRADPRDRSVQQASEQKQHLRNKIWNK